MTRMFQGCSDLKWERTWHNRGIERRRVRGDCRRGGQGQGSQGMGLCKWTGLYFTHRELFWGDGFVVYGEKMVWAAETHLETREGVPRWGNCRIEKTN